MMKRVIYVCFFALFLASCGSTKSNKSLDNEVVRRADIPTKPKHRVELNRNTPRVAHVDKANEKREKRNNVALEPSNSSKQEIISYAKTFQGTRYKFGGTTSAGMDCSGLVCVAFQKENIDLPRISRDIATKGLPISLREIEEGDLVFFKTTNKNVISHVGLVVEADDGKVRFIHSTTQAGVIISSLDETYWKKAFAEVRRII